MPSSDSRRWIPSVDRLLASPAIQPMIERTSRGFIADLLRSVLEQIRRQLDSDAAEAWLEEGVEKHVVERLAREFDRVLRPSLCRVINATGVILHTNLGRAPLSRQALERIMETSGHYSNLEYDLEKGRRGERDGHTSQLLQSLLGCEEAIVVNNNAGAVFLILNTLAENGEVIISRGELVEIGNSFRIPDILCKSGAVLREVGTTNRTRLRDYQDAVNERTRLVLRVHPSNFRILGFTSRPGVAELISFCRSLSIPLIEDLGSGCLTDLEPWGISDEPSPRRNLELGVHLVCFSGDKLLGGPQAGIIAGEAALVRKIRSNPLFRALRVDKLVFAALEGTLQSYQLNREGIHILAIEMIRRSAQSIGERSEAIISRVKALLKDFEVTLSDGLSMIGGGSTPEHGIPTRLITLCSVRTPAIEVERRLRMSKPPILARIGRDCVLLDLRTVSPEEEPSLVRALENLGS